MLTRDDEQDVHPLYHFVSRRKASRYNASGGDFAMLEFALEFVEEEEEDGKHEIGNGVISQARGAAKVDVRQQVIQSLLSSPRSARHFSSCCSPAIRARPDRFPLSRTLAPRTASVFIASVLRRLGEQTREERSKKERLRARGRAKRGPREAARRARGAHSSLPELPPAFNQRLC